MKVLITGARGQLGQDLQKLCAERRVEVQAHGLDELDVTKLDAVRAALRQVRPSAVVNCAAYNAVDRAETEFDRACLVNGIGPRNLAIAAEELGVPLMHFSTDYVFDGASTTPYTIADAPAPINRYGQSKLLGERFVQALCRRHFVVRLSWVFGTGGVNFPRKILEWSRGKRTLPIVTDQVACPAYTVDIAATAWALLETGAYGRYHVTNQGVTSRFEWARLVARRAGLAVEIVPATERDFPTAARRPRFSALDPFPLAETIGKLLPPWQDATERFLTELGCAG